MTTTALTVRDPRQDKREPARASGRCRRAAEHYVRHGCKSLGPSLLWAGYSAWTAKEPSKNGFTHDWMLSVARYWNKGSQITARAHLAKAIAALADMVDDPEVGPAARGAAAKTIIDVAKKEEETEDKVLATAEDQAKYMNLVRHWKRVFFRRGLLLGRHLPAVKKNPALRKRAFLMLANLNYILDKGPKPEGWDEPPQDDVIEAEVVEG